MKTLAPYILVLAIALVAAGVGYSAAPAPVTSLKTTGITIVDSAGKTRATLGMEGNDTALSLFDAASKLRVRVSCSQTNEVMSMHDASGNARYGISCLPDNTIITMRDGSLNEVWMKTNEGALILVDPKTKAVLWTSKPAQ